MPVPCYQIKDFHVDVAAGHVKVDVQTWTRAAKNTNVGSILQLVANQVVALEGEPMRWNSHGARFVVYGAKREDVETLLRVQSSPCFVAETSCDLSLCLDLYRSPPNAGQEGWVPTAAGKLVSDAKYGRSAKAAEKLVRMAADFVSRHPILKQSLVVAAVPSTDRLGTAPKGQLPARLAAGIAERCGMDMVSLERAKPRAKKQKDLGKEDDPDQHQQCTMACDARGADRTVLIVDDLMGHGSSVKEAARALRAAGFGRVFSLVMVKKAEGTQGYSFNAQ